MSSILLVKVALTLWIVTHTVSQEIPVTSRAPKPLSCQLCLSGWVMILTAVSGLVFGVPAMSPVDAGAIWAVSVLIEALYTRLQMIIL